MFGGPKKLSVAVKNATCSNTSCGMLSSDGMIGRVAAIEDVDELLEAGMRLHDTLPETSGVYF